MNKSCLLKTLPILVALALVQGCGGPEVYREEAFNLKSPYRKEVKHAAPVACGAAKMALLGQGYGMEVETPEKMKGLKHFQPDEDLHAVLAMNVVCVPSASGSIIFANAVQSVYRLKETRGSVGIGVSAVGSFKVPWGNEAESLVKVGSETVSDEEFYRRFFELVGKNLKFLPVIPLQ